MKDCQILLAGKTKGNFPLMFDIFQAGLAEGEDMKTVLLISSVEISGLALRDKQHDLLLAELDPALHGELGVVQEDALSHQLVLGLSEDFQTKVVIMMI